MKIVAIIFIVGIGGYFLSQWIESVALNEVDNVVQTDNDIDSFFTNFKTILTNKEGHIKHTIQGDSLIHSDNSTSLINKPILKIHELDQVDWEVSALTAKIIDTEDTIKFNTNVIVLSLFDTANNTTLKTNELEFLTKKKIMRTPKTVSIETSNSYTTAIGMITYTDKQQILLLDNVRSTYDN